MGARLTRVRCRDAVTDLEEAIANCHDIALLVLTIAFLVLANPMKSTASSKGILWLGFGTRFHCAADFRL